MQVKQELYRLINSCDMTGERGVVRSIHKAVIQLLKHNGLAEYRTIRPRNVGVHPTCRSCMGLDPLSSQTLFDKITNEGFSVDIMENPTVFEKGDGPFGEEQLIFNQTNVENSGEMLPPIIPSDMWFISVTCSHTFSTARYPGSNCIMTVPELADEDGRVCTEKVFARCPSYNDVITAGIPTLVVRKEVEVDVPILPKFLSEIGNLTHGVHRQESKIQVMIAAFMEYHNPLAEKDWGKVAAKVEERRPHYKGQVLEMTEYIAKWGVKMPRDSGS